MNHMKFDVFVRRAAGLLARRSLFGGLSAALLTAAGIPHIAEAKTGKKNGKNRKSCKKGAKCKVKDLDTLIDQCGDVLCEFKSSC